MIVTNYTQVGSHGSPVAGSVPAQETLKRSPFRSRISIASNQPPSEEEASLWVGAEPDTLRLALGLGGLGILHMRPAQRMSPTTGRDEERDVHSVTIATMHKYIYAICFIYKIHFR
jgi:hypothetical protein